MEIIKFAEVEFDWQDMLADSLKRSRRKKASDDMIVAVKRAYDEGAKFLI